jgi:hypothetical protein
MQRRLGALGSALRGTAAALLCALALAEGGCAQPPAEPGRSVAVEPVFFVGVVEVTRDPEHGPGVLLSTATEEVLVAGALGSRLARYEGEVVAVRGRLLERANEPATIVVRAFRVLGLPGHAQGA